MWRIFWILRIGYRRISRYLFAHDLLHCRLPAASELQSPRFRTAQCHRHGAVTDTLPHAGRTAASGERPSIRSRQLRLCSRATTFRKSSDQCRDTPRILVALTSDPVAIIPCAWRSASRTCKPQSDCQTINSVDRFFKLRRVATTGVLALPASLAAAVDRASVTWRGPEKQGHGRFSGCSKFAARASKIPDPLRKIR